MRFEYHNETLDTATMAVFATGLAWMPSIYVSSERVCFLELCRKRWTESHFRCLPRAEALRYADLYNMTALREILTFSPQVGMETDIVGGLERYVERLKKNGRKSEGGRLVREVQVEVDSIEAVCRTEIEKNSVSRWANPFAAEVLVRHGASGSTAAR